MTTIQVRMDERTKRDTKKVLDKLGLDMSTAVTMLFKQIVLTRSIPFPLLTENGMTAEEENEILRRSEEAERGENLSPPLTGKEIVNYLKRRS